MKRFRNSVKAARSVRPGSCVFTPDEVAQLLMQIDELQGYDISFEETENGTAQFTIGDSVYSVMDIAPVI
mgnify:CR=1 FL=1|jgi:hypothetical protein